MCRNKMKAHSKFYACSLCITVVIFVCIYSKNPLDFMSVKPSLVSGYFNDF